GALPARPGPDPGRRRPRVRLLCGGRGIGEEEAKLPGVGGGFTKAALVAWPVKPGDQVDDGQVIVEIETAKAVVELPCPWDGTVTRLLAEEGQTVEGGVPIIAG